MIYSGIVILVFLVFHLKTFKYGDKPLGLVTFQQTGYLDCYVVAHASLRLPPLVR